MKTALIEPAVVALERGWTMADLAQLVKARLTFLVLLTTAVGFYAGWRGPMDFIALLHACSAPRSPRRGPPRSINGGNISSTPLWCGRRRGRFRPVVCCRAKA